MFCQGFEFVVNLGISLNRHNSGSGYDWKFLGFVLQFDRLLSEIQGFNGVSCKFVDFQEFFLDLMFCMVEA